MRLPIDPINPDPDVLAQAADILKRGGLVAYPTDTLYALGVDPRSDSAVQALFDVKGRDPSLAIPLIAADIDQAQQAGALGPAERRLAESFWPGPLTIVVPAAGGLSELLSTHGTLAVRVPSHAVARGLAAALGACVTSTSANPSGKPAAQTADAVAAAFGDRIDLILDAGPCPGGPPSTVVEIVEGRAKLLRAGAVAWDRVLRSLG
jgi:L-threonylcarbamoyladenylate synthase